jgi:hypothetical protein
MGMQIDTILWRRLDAAGHDACRLIQRNDSRRLEGTAVFQHEGVPACLAYQVDCDGQWRTREGAVHGWVGALRLDLQITRTPSGIWTLNGREIYHVDGCGDLDFGFTPATNLFQLRRIALEAGQATDVPVAWLDVPAGTLETLYQRYERRGARQYWYEAPRFGYFAILQVNAAGFVERYPNLWESVEIQGS